MPIEPQAKPSFLERWFPPLALWYEGSRARLRIIRKSEQKLEELGRTWRNDPPDDRMTGDWNPGTSPSDNIQANLEQKQMQASEMTQTHGHAAGITQKMMVAVVGEGMSPQSDIDPEEVGLKDETADKIQDKFERGFEMWSKSAGTDRMEFWTAEQLACRSLMDRGEIVSLRVPRKPTRTNPFTTRLMLVEASRLKSPVDWSGGGILDHGIEMDLYGDRKAYWIKKDVNSDGKVERFLPDYMEHFTRVPAFDRLGHPNVVHAFWRKEVGQQRGVPELAPVLKRFRLLQNYEVAEQVAAWMSACIGLIIESSSPESSRKAWTNQENELDSKTQNYLSRFFPGMVFYPGQGESAKPFYPGRPNQMYGDYTDRMVAGVTATLPAPDEVIFSKYGEATYSAARAMVLDFIKLIKVWQKVLCHQFCIPYWEMITEEMVLRRMVPTIQTESFFRMRKEYSESSWGSPAYGLLDPVKEIQALEMAVEDDFITRKEANSHLGNDWLRTAKQRKREDAKLEKLGRKTSIGRDAKAEKEEEGGQEAPTAPKKSRNNGRPTPANAGA